MIEPQAAIAVSGDIFRRGGLIGLMNRLRYGGSAIGRCLALALLLLQALAIDAADAQERQGSWGVEAGQPLGEALSRFGKQHEYDIIVAEALVEGERAAPVEEARSAYDALTWRPLIDTTNDPIISRRRPKGWVSWQRSEDYYNEGLLVWLEVDSILRSKSGGRKSLDDFARAFFGMRDGGWGVLTYDFDQVVATLNRIQPHDWSSLLKMRVEGVSDRAPLAGFEANGYRLIYIDEPTAAFRNQQKRRNQTDLSYSLGLVMGKGGAVSAVTWDSPAFEARLDVGDTIVAVNGREYADDRLISAIRAAKLEARPVELLVKSGTRYRGLTIDYRGGLRYSRLEKIGEGEGGLDRLLAPR